MKICLAASAGGHLTQLLKIKHIWKNKSHFYITNNKSALGLLGTDSRVYLIKWGNRNYPHLIAMIIFQCLRIILKEKPDVLISTGAAAGCIPAILTKLIGGKVIWIDTISHADYLTMSGRIVRLFADMFLVQWPELAEKYPGVIYMGAVI